MSNNNQFLQRNSESKKQNENFYNISHKSKVNINEKMTNDSSNDFSIFHIDNTFEKNNPFKNVNNIKKCKIYPFFGGQIYENPIEESTPNIKDNINIFQGGQVDNEYQIYKNITKGRNINNNFKRNIGLKVDLDNKDSNISHSKKDNNNIDNNGININNIYNINEGEDKEEEKLYTIGEEEKINTNDKDEDRKLYHNNRNYQQDLSCSNSGVSNYYKYIKNYCDDCQRFPFFLKMDENEPEFILANKNMTLREVLKRRNIDVENIDLFCKDNQKKVFLDETIESQNIRPYSYIQNIVN